MLAEYYRRVGNPGRAAEHLRLAEQGSGEAPPGPP
jgi:hypothetical protein